ncbi:hypothetical protein K440DRAFT_608616 [Wilcoxina mikolae CBS 423.85]|nr:hypothetical protein K440DRAFT_608616 [Wilcoxina mikolae CBS 423.85]
MKNEKREESEKQENEKQEPRETNENLARNLLYSNLHQHPPLHPLVVPFKVGAILRSFPTSRFNETVLTILRSFPTSRFNETVLIILFLRNSRILRPSHVVPV